MKIKELLQRSCEKVNDYSGFPICMPYFIQSMATILVVDAHFRVGRSKENVNIGDIISVLNQSDLLNSIGQFCQLNGFFEWFMEQEEPTQDDENDAMWYDLEFVGEKWNEYAKKRC